LISVYSRRRLWAPSQREVLRWQTTVTERVRPLRQRLAGDRQRHLPLHWGGQSGRLIAAPTAETECGASVRGDVEVQPCAGGEILRRLCLLRMTGGPHPALRATCPPCGARKAVRAYADPPAFRPLRKYRLRFLCHWQREAGIPRARGRLAGRIRPSPAAGRGRSSDFTALRSE